MDMGDPQTSVATRENLRTLSALTRPHLRVLALGVLLGLASTATALATPLATKWVIDSLGGDAALLQPVGLLLGLLVIGSIAAFTQWILLGRLAENVVLEARSSLVERFFWAKLEQIQRFRAGELVTRVTSDTVLLREAVTSSLVQIINGVVSLMGTVVLMAVLDLPLFLGTLVALVVVGTIMGILMPMIGAAEKEAQRALGELGGILEGGLRALRTVKSSRAESREIDRVRDEARESARHSIRSVWVSAIAWTIAGGGIQLAIIAILGFGAWRVSLGDIAVSTLIAFLLYAFNIIDPISELTMAFSQLQSGLAAASRIRETEHLDLEDLHAGRPGASSVGSGPLISLHDVVARYDGAKGTALDGVTLDIARVGHTALVGPSGAGKTTVFSLLLRFLDAERGSMRLDGVPFADLSIDEVRRRIAYVEQETPIVPGTVRENVLYRCPTADDDEAWAALEAVRLGDRVRSLPDGLDTPVASTTLSGGERQRLAVARALVRPPGILLLDEATAQLDGVTEAAIHSVIADAARSGAVVTIAHRLSTVIDADQIIILEEGRVRDAGTHTELLARDALYGEFITALRIATP